MADKVSTIRIKTVGMDDAANEVEAFSRKYSAANVRIEQALKSLNAAMASDNLDKQTASQNRYNEAKERAARIAERAGVTDQMKGLDFRQQDVDRAFENARKKYEQNSEAMQAAERSHAEESADISRRKLELGETEWREAADTARKEGSKRYEEQVKADNALLEEEARLASESQKIRDKSAMDGAKLQLKINADEYKAAVKADGDKVKELERIDSEYAKATQSKLNYGLGNLETDYKKQRSLHAENAEALEKIDATYEANRERLMEQDAANQSRLSGGGLSGFGGKMILGMAAGRAFGDALGDRHGGQEVGSLVSGFMFGGPEVGLEIAGIELIGNAFKAMREQTEGAAKIAEDYANTLSNLSDQWSKLGTSVGKSDSFKNSLDGIVAATKSNADKANADYAAALPKDLLESAIDHMNPFSPTRQNIDAALADKAEALKNNQLARDLRKQETADMAADQEKIFAAEQNLTKVSGEANGKLRDRDIVTARIALNHEKITAKQREENAESDASMKISKSISDDLNERVRKASADPNTTLPFMAALSQKAADDEQNYRDTLEARKNLDAQHAMDAKEQAERDATELEDVGRRKGKERTQEASDKFEGIVGGGQAGGKYIDLRSFGWNTQLKPVIPPSQLSGGNTGNPDRMLKNKAYEKSMQDYRDKHPMKHAPFNKDNSKYGYAGIRIRATDAYLGQDGNRHFNGAGSGISGVLTPEQYKNLSDAEKAARSPGTLPVAKPEGASSITKEWRDTQAGLDKNWMTMNRGPVRDAYQKAGRLSPHDQFQKDYKGIDPQQRSALESAKAQLRKDRHPEDDPTNQANLKAGQYMHYMNQHPELNANNRAALKDGQFRHQQATHPHDAAHGWGTSDHTKARNFLGETGSISGALTTQATKSPMEISLSRIEIILKNIEMRGGLS